MTHTPVSALLQAVRQVWIPPDPSHYRGLSVFPIYPGLRWNADDVRPIGYAPLPCAIDAAMAIVSELATPRVPQLLIKNVSQTMILGIDGDELVGGKQNRVLNTSVLLGLGDTAVPVSCAERGRWAQTGSASFQGGERLTHGMRASSHGHVGHNLASGHSGHASDQSAVWRDIDGGHARHGVECRTAALHALYRHQKDVIATYEAALPYPRNAVGIVVALDGQIAGLDLFDRSSTAQQYWPRLVRACAAEAIDSGQRECASEPADWLTALRQSHCTVFPSPGAGWDVRIQNETCHGSALVYEQQLLHLSLFKKVEAKS